MTVVFLLLTAFVLEAQKDAKNVYDGNQHYISGKVPQSTEFYRNAIKINPFNYKAHFNLGNSLYKNAKMVKKSKENFIQGGKRVTPDSLANLIFDEAAQSFAQVANSVSNKDTLHRAWHNIGNCHLQKKDFAGAVEAYKKALKFDPKDEETRYNLAYALKNMPKQNKSGGGGSSNKPKEDPKDPKKNSQPNMNKDQAEQLLKALMKDEKKLQEKRKQKQQDASNTTVDKDW